MNVNGWATGLLLGLALALVSVPGMGEHLDVHPHVIRVKSMAGGFYALQGAGSRIGVLTGSDGVLMVDAGHAHAAPKVVATLRSLSDKPLRFLLVTHVGARHPGGSGAFAKLGATVIGRGRSRAQFIEQGVAPAALRSVTDNKTVTLHFDAQEIQLIPVPSACTDGGLLVYFPQLDILMTGDVYRAPGYPQVDTARGGSVHGLLTALAKAIAVAGPDTLILPSHGPTVGRTALVAHREMILDVKTAVQRLVEAGKTERQILTAHVTAGYDASVGQPETAARFVRALYVAAKAGA